VATYFFLPSFRKAKFCGVPSGAVVKVGYNKLHKFKCLANLMRTVMREVKKIIGSCK
jgi:hypothetical protein